MSAETGSLGLGLREGRRRGGINEFALWFILAILLLVPIPLASVRPALWPIFAGLVGIGLVVHGASLALRRLSPALPLRAVWLEAILWLGFVALALVQVLPIGSWIDLALTLPDQAALPLRTLSITPGTTALTLVQLCGYGGLAYLAAQSSVRESRARRLQMGIVVVVALHALYGIMALTQWGDTILGLEKWAYAGSATGTFVNRNSFATFLGLGLVNAVGLFAADVAGARQQGRQVLAAVFVAAPAAAAGGVILVALVLTTSRMGLAASLAGAAATALLALGRSGSQGARIALVAAVAVSVAAVVAWLYGQGVLERLGSVERDFDVRAQLYTQTWQLIMQRPLTGFGGGAFQYAFPLVHSLPVSLDLVWDRAHSIYLGLWTEFGLIGGTLPLLALAAAGIRLLMRYFSSVTVSANGIAALGAIVICTIHSLVDFSLEIPAVAYLFAAIVGAGLGNSFRFRAREAA